MSRRLAALPWWFCLVLLCLPRVARATPRWDDVLEQPVAWYATAEARAIAECVLTYQINPAGGWPKNHDMTRPPGPGAFDKLDESLPTLDNGGTHTQLKFLARVHAAQPDARWAAAIGRGVDYLLKAQYENGGWPQFYPLRTGYYSHITFNDDAMIGALEVLRAVSQRAPGFDALGEEQRARASDAVSRGIACILRCQIREAGELTAWCAQHDEVTLAPVAARKYEHVSVSGMETVGIVRFLMGIEHPSPEEVAAIEAAVRWLERVKITGVRLVKVPDPSLPHGHDTRVIPDDSAPPLWARFYELGTHRPIFSGRNGVVCYTLAEIEPERRSGYHWYVRDPRRLLEREYPIWAKRIARPAIPGTMVPPSGTPD